MNPTQQLSQSAKCSVLLVFLAASCLLARPCSAEPGGAGEVREVAVERSLTASFLAQATRCEHLLDSSIVDFFLPGSLDLEHGGFAENPAADGTFRMGKGKFVTLQARQLWTFSALAADGVQPERLRSAAAHGAEFLARFLDPVHGGYFTTVAADGTPQVRRKHLYHQAFVIHGLAAWHRLSRDPAALEGAVALFRLIDDKAHDSVNGGYFEWFEEDWQPVTESSQGPWIGPPGVKTFNTHLHLLEGFTELYREWPDPILASRLRELIVINTLAVRSRSAACNLDQWTHDWNAATAGQQCSYGHDLECVWLVMRALRTLGESTAPLRGWARGVTDHALAAGFDREHGGIFLSGEPGALSATEFRKEWWVQAEALVAFLEQYQVDRTPADLAAFNATLDFIENHQIAAAGGWYATLQADGTSIPDSAFAAARASQWQGAYHAARALHQSAQRLRELARGVANQ